MTKLGDVSNTSILDNYNFRFKMDEKGMNDKAFDESSLKDDLLSLLSSYYDMTPDRIECAFNQVDQNKDGKISYDECNAMLQQFGITMDDDVFDLLVRQVDVDQSQGLTLNEFAVMLQRLKMLSLFQPTVIYKLLGDCFIGSLSQLSYCNEKVVIQRPIMSVEDFFMNPDPVWSMVNWVSLSSCEALSIQRLGVRYRLHPLVIEDMIYREKKAKIDRYKTHFLVTIPLIRFIKEPTEEDMLDETSSLSSDQTTTEGTLFQRKASINELILSNMQQKSIHQKNRSFSIQPLNIVYVFMNPWAKNSHAIITATEQNDNGIWEYIYHLLNRNDSRNRSENGFYMIYVMLDYVVDSYVTVLSSFAERIQAIESTSVDAAAVCNSVQLSRELDLFQKGVIEPIFVIIEALQQSPACSHRVSVYLNDVKDHLQQLIDDIQYCSHRSSNVYNHAQQARERKQDKILLILTLITAIFTPISFIAGVFGMNFEYMPILDKWYGYLLFWLYSVIIVIGLIVFFRFIIKRM